jgi:hypothetical protein
MGFGRMLGGIIVGWLTTAVGTIGFSFALAVYLKRMGVNFGEDVPVPSWVEIAYVVHGLAMGFGGGYVANAVGGHARTALYLGALSSAMGIAYLITNVHGSVMYRMALALVPLPASALAHAVWKKRHPRVSTKSD